MCMCMCMYMEEEEVKRRVSESLVRKLAHGILPSKIEAAAEIRLFAKWDDLNRSSLAHAGAVPLLLHYSSTADSHDSSSASASLREKSLAALYNLSLNPHIKLSLASSASVLLPLLASPSSSSTSTSSSSSSSSAVPSPDSLSSLVASILLSLMHDPLPRSAVLGLPHLAPSLVSLLRHGGSKAKADALRTLFQAISTRNPSASAPPPDPPSQPAGIRNPTSHQDTGGRRLDGVNDDEEQHLARCVTAFKEDLMKEGLVPLLLMLTACGRPRLAEDCFALLTELIKGFPAGAAAVLAAPAGMDLILGGMESEEKEEGGTGGVAKQPRAGRLRENATALMVALWESGGCERTAAGAAAAPRAMAAAARMICGEVVATERGRKKAEALAEVLGAQMAATVPDSLPEPRQHHHQRLPPQPRSLEGMTARSPPAAAAAEGSSSGGRAESKGSGWSWQRQKVSYLVRALNSLLPKRHSSAAKRRGSA